MSEVGRVFVNWSGIDNLHSNPLDARIMSIDLSFVKNKSRLSLCFEHQGDHKVKVVSDTSFNDVTKVIKICERVVMLECLMECVGKKVIKLSYEK